jgi:hypothetical protein
MLHYASNFSWFTHLPNHEHVTGSSLTYSVLDSLFAMGRFFEIQHGLLPFISRYCITPQHEGIWPPYDPLYDVFEKYGIRYASSPYVFRTASYGTVQIMYRTNLGLGSNHYAMSQVGVNKIALCVEKAYTAVMENRTVIFNVHQANFCKDRVATTLIKQLLERLIAQDECTVIFLPAEKVVAHAHSNAYIETELVLSE